MSRSLLRSFAAEGEAFLITGSRQQADVEVEPATCDLAKIEVWVGRGLESPLSLADTSLGMGKCMC